MTFMDLTDCYIKTAVAGVDMTFREALVECVNRNVPGIPFAEKSKGITGHFSLRAAFLDVIIPRDMVHGAHLLGDGVTHIDLSAWEDKDALDVPVSGMIVKNLATLSPSTSPLKALALMEKFSTHYLFLIGDEHYFGVITRLGISKLILESGYGKK